jgi:hypothetical protein
LHRPKQRLLTYLFGSHQILVKGIFLLGFYLLELIPFFIVMPLELLTVIRLKFDNQVVDVHQQRYNGSDLVPELPRVLVVLSQEAV